MYLVPIFINDWMWFATELCIFFNTRTYFFSDYLRCVRGTFLNRKSYHWKYYMKWEKKLAKRRARIPRFQIKFHSCAKKPVFSSGSQYLHCSYKKLSIKSSISRKRSIWIKNWREWFLFVFIFPINYSLQFFI